MGPLPSIGYEMTPHFLSQIQAGGGYSACPPATSRLSLLPAKPRCPLEPTDTKITHVLLRIQAGGGCSGFPPATSRISLLPAKPRCPLESTDTKITHVLLRIQTRPLPGAGARGWIYRGYWRSGEPSAGRAEMRAQSPGVRNEAGMSFRINRYENHSRPIADCQPALAAGAAAMTDRRG
jgi:hypothetical protein